MYRKIWLFQMACKYMRCGNMDWTHLTHKFSIHGLDSSDPQIFHSRIGLIWPTKFPFTGCCAEGGEYSRSIKVGSLLNRRGKDSLHKTLAVNRTLQSEFLCDFLTALWFTLVSISHWNRNWRIKILLPSRQWDSDCLSVAQQSKRQYIRAAGDRLAWPRR